MAKLRNIVNDYSFELPSDEEIINTMKNGLSKNTAINFLGNNKVLSQNKTIKEHHILDNLKSVIDEENHNIKVYYDNDTVGYTDNTNFYNVIGKQILDLHLFGYRQIKAVKFGTDYVQVQLYFNDAGTWKKSYLIFYKLSSYDLAQTSQYKNVLFINDDKFADANKVNIVSGFDDHNVIISRNYTYEYRNHVYVGASFYTTSFFKEILNAHLLKITDEEQKKLIDLEQQKFEANHFEFAGRMVTLNLPAELQSDYRRSFKSVVEIQDLSTYYDYYSSYSSINEYLDSLIINRYKGFDSFAEYELSFALNYVNENIELFKDNKLELAKTPFAVDQTIKKQELSDKPVPVPQKVQEDNEQQLDDNEVPEQMVETKELEQQEQSDNSNQESTQKEIADSKPVKQNNADKTKEEINNKPVEQKNEDVTKKITSSDNNDITNTDDNSSTNDALADFMKQSTHNTTNLQDTIDNDIETDNDSKIKKTPSAQAEISDNEEKTSMYPEQAKPRMVSEHAHQPSNNLELQNMLNNMIDQTKTNNSSSNDQKTTNNETNSGSGRTLNGVDLAEFYKIKND